VHGVVPPSSTPSDAPGEQATWRLRAVRLRLWPEAKPAVPVHEHGWVHAGNERVLRRLLAEQQPRVAVELGAWLGLCTQLLLEAAPQLSVFAVDIWDAETLLSTQASQYEHDADAMSILRTVPLHETFLANTWEHRHRLFPLRMKTVDGLRTIHRLGVPVDLIYVDADHSRDAVLEELRAIDEWFPEATVVGDDWQWLAVRGAVQSFAEEHGREVESHPRENWWRLSRRAPAAPQPASKRARVEFVPPETR
jgi:hypothetical protein